MTALQKTVFELCDSYKFEIETLRGEHQAKVERLCGLYFVELGCKDTFYEAEKVQVLLEL